MQDSRSPYLNIVTLDGRIKSAWVKLNNFFLLSRIYTANYYSDYVQINFVVQLERIHSLAGADFFWIIIVPDGDLYLKPETFLSVDPECHFNDDESYYTVEETQTY